MSYRVRLPVFEGPFDLLVYLIETSEMDIYDIRISEITGQYIQYLRDMKDMNVRLSSEFMVLAAELLQLKSRMMLPKAPKLQGQAVQEDPREGLVERLIAYKRCKQAAGKLKECAERAEKSHSKPQEDISVYTSHPDEYLDLTTEDFARAFRGFLHRKKRIEETRKRYTLLERDRRTMEERRAYIRSLFDGINQDVSSRDFRELIPEGGGRRDVVVSFLSMLQMVREHYLDVVQNSIYGDIEVRRGPRTFDDFDSADPDAEDAGDGETAKET